MNANNEVPIQGSLDPEDWEAVRRLGHRMVDDMLAHVRDVRQRPAWQAMPQTARERIDTPVPETGTDLSEIYDDFREAVLPYGLGNLHPRFWGWVIGSGTFTGALAEFLSSALNTNVAGFATAPIVVEEQVLEWFRQVFAMPVGTSGLLVSGGSMANYVGVAAGLTAKVGPELRAKGAFGLERRPMVYASDATHFSVRRAVQQIGLGDASYRIIATNEAAQIDVAALRCAIAEDRNAGHAPCLLIGNAGTVGIGGFDDLVALRRIADEERLWLHVDGAFGGMLALAPALRSRVEGIERVDSLAFDLHKWMHAPTEAACVLIRDAAAHLATFRVDGAYLRDMADGPAVSVNRFTNLGLQQSRSSRGIKVWFSIREHGFRKLGESVAMNVAQAETLAAAVAADDELELLAPVACNIVCFRSVPKGYSGDLNALNTEVLTRLNARGIAIPSSYKIRGNFAIRCCITNHRTTDADLTLFLAAVREVTQEILQEMEATACWPARARCARIRHRPE